MNIYYWMASTQAALTAATMVLSGGQFVPIDPNYRVGSGTSGTWYATLTSTTVLTPPAGVTDISNDPVNLPLAKQVVGVWA